MCATATSKLLLKSMPCTMDELGQLIQELKLIIPRSLNSFGRRRVLLEYSDADEAQEALNQLLGLNDILDKPLRVSCFGPRAKTETETSSKTANKSTQATTAGSCKDSKTPPAQAEQINKYVQKLYACNNQFDFIQPPPPYLRYAYPPINADILTEIGNALKSNERFYIQVLHLMNRMNLAPPFGPRLEGVILQPQPTQTTATQTEKCRSETESELENEEDEQQKKKKQKLKRPAEPSVIPEQYRKRARQILQAGKAAAATSTATKESIDSPTFAAPKIELKLPTTLPTAPQLPQQRLTQQQLQELPIYKNYKLGEPSNKLYIKNLDKNVTEQQLRTLYTRYAPPESLEIKVMQQGRMKGQAFVEFKDQAAATSTAVVVAQALAETNGLIWQQKPMIVCYGKQQAQQP